jgi:hypothetical protein
MPADLSRAIWRKSTTTEPAADCIEFADLGGHCALRDSTDPDGPTLLFTAFEWECFLDGVDKGEFHRR